MESTMNVRERAAQFLTELETRKRSPVKFNTPKNYSSYIRNWISPCIGQDDCSTFGNLELRDFISLMRDEELADSTIIGISNLVKQILSSALSHRGDQLYPVVWNNDFLDLPILDPRNQKTPTASREELEGIIGRGEGRFKSMYAILAGTGMRIGEALALQAPMRADDGKGNQWIPEHGKINIRGQIQQGVFTTPKTKAGYRDIEVSRELRPLLDELCDRRYLFGYPDKTLPSATANDVRNKDGLKGWHVLRRFRVTWLRETGTPEDILQHWLGHNSNRSITDRYSKLAQNVKLRQEWAEKAGLGFCLGNPVI